MTAPTEFTYAPDVVIAANNAFLSLIDGGGGPGQIRIRTDGDVLLSTVVLNEPGGTIDPGTGQMQLSISGPDTAAAATGQAAYGEVTDAAGVVLLSLPSVAGTGPLSGYLVLDSLSIIDGGDISIISGVIG